MTGLYLYGLIVPPAPRLSAVNGLDKQPIQLKLMDPFVVIFSEAQQERYLASRANLLAHETVLEKVMNEGHPALLPLQFGLVVSDWDQVKQDLLDPKQTELQALLSTLQGKREVGIKVFWNPEQELQLGLEENPNLKQQRDAMTGKPLGLDAVVQIGQALEQLLEQRRQAIMDAFVEALSPLSSDRVEGDLLTENMAYNGAYLIDWDLEPEFAHRVEQLDQHFQGRLRIRYNNFTAPYNFARL